MRLEEINRDFFNELVIDGAPSGEGWYYDKISTTVYKKMIYVYKSFRTIPSAREYSSEGIEIEKLFGDRYKITIDGKII